MSNVEFNTAHVLIVVSLSHLSNLFVSWFIHFLQHRTVFGIPLYQIHLRGHHEIQRSKRTLRDYLNISIGHCLWLLMILGTLTTYYLLFPTWIAVTFIADALFVTMFAYYVHREYDKSSSWLSRFEWFRRCRALHRVHHSYFGEAFFKSKNYAFGGPLAGNFMDYLLGTFEGQESSKERTNYA